MVPSPPSIASSTAEANQVEGDPEDIPEEPDADLGGSIPRPTAPVDAEPITPANASHRWSEWVELYAEARPLTAGALRHSRLRVEAGETPALEVVFDNRHQCDLFLADPENKRNLRNFIAEKWEGGTVFVLNFSAPEPDPVSGTEPVSPPLASLEALARREPIIPTLLEMFEGRILDAST